MSAAESSALAQFWLGRDAPPPDVKVPARHCMPFPAGPLIPRPHTDQPRADCHVSALQRGRFAMLMLNMLVRTTAGQGAAYSQTLPTAIYASWAWLKRHESVFETIASESTPRPSVLPLPVPTMQGAETDGTFTHRAVALVYAYARVTLGSSSADQILPREFDHLRARFTEAYQDKLKPHKLEKAQKLRADANAIELNRASPVNAATRSTLPFTPPLYTCDCCDLAEPPLQLDADAFDKLARPTCDLQAGMATLFLLLAHTHLAVGPRQGAHPFPRHDDLALWLRFSLTSLAASTAGGAQQSVPARVALMVVAGLQSVCTKIKARKVMVDQADDHQPRSLATQAVDPLLMALQGFANRHLSLDPNHQVSVAKQLWRRVSLPSGPPIDSIIDQVADFAQEAASALTDPLLILSMHLNKQDLAKQATGFLHRQLQATMPRRPHLPKGVKGPKLAFEDRTRKRFLPLARLHMVKGLSELVDGSSQSVMEVMAKAATLANGKDKLVTLDNLSIGGAPT